MMLSTTAIYRLFLFSYSVAIGLFKICVMLINCLACIQIKLFNELDVL